MLGSFHALFQLSEKFDLWRIPDQEVYYQRQPYFNFFIVVGSPQSKISRGSRLRELTYLKDLNGVDIMWLHNLELSEVDGFGRQNKHTAMITELQRWLLTSS